jgi:hypothetical protein
LTKKKSALEVGKNLSVIHEGNRNSSSIAGERTTDRRSWGGKDGSGHLTNDLNKTNENYSAFDRPRQVNSQSMSSEFSQSATNNLKSFRSNIGSKQNQKITAGPLPFATQSVHNLSEHDTNELFVSKNQEIPDATANIFLESEFNKFSP